jgi:hypothetical protein
MLWSIVLPPEKAADSVPAKIRRPQKVADPPDEFDLVVEPHLMGAPPGFMDQISSVGPALQRHVSARHAPETGLTVCVRSACIAWDREDQPEGT